MINPLTGVPLGELSHIAVFPASHYVTPKEKLEEAIKDLEEELEQRVRYFEENGKLIEAQRIAQRTRYDIEMLQEIGFCSGIENYSRVLSRRAPGSSPYTLHRLLPEGFPADRGREPCYPAAGPRDVSRRPRAQGKSGRKRLPPAERL